MTARDRVTVSGSNRGVPRSTKRPRPSLYVCLNIDSMGNCSGLSLVVPVLKRRCARARNPEVHSKQAWVPPQSGPISESKTTDAGDHSGGGDNAAPRPPLRRSRRLTATTKSWGRVTNGQVPVELSDSAVSTNHDSSGKWNFLHAFRIADCCVGDDVRRSGSCRLQRQWGEKHRRKGAGARNYGTTAAPPLRGSE